MTDFLPKEVLEGLELARRRDLKKKNRLRVRVGEETYPILRSWETGFALDRENTEHLRGLVDVYDGARHLYQALIVAAREDGHEMSFDFKRATQHREGPPLDYDRPDDAPVGLLPR
ncbi:hypothetical protein [Celeribacter indicus]|uniref:Uncharacterized protein n=1 Tax=Celeribacter indicus TaxID=1208324 RepID=A0A0B5DNZ0_9RHOB|nr:hypothetical protein [Celeribacter indicus]AJE45303.1 hypothetical protein P73_0588 [Celeribacter indicus]SDX20389.1 hypothetical protein SAMN05443573_11738 [Celeribacter indicus]